MNLFDEDIIIKTKLVKSSEAFIRLREKRIIEAISFKSGTINVPHKTVITKLLNKKEVFFLKPGKETQRLKPNKYDMTPLVGSSNIKEIKRFSFEDIWEYLVKISIINQITFKKVLVLLYRLCYFIDHREVKNGILRYSPSNDISEYIGKIDYSLKDGFRDKFKKDEIGIWEYLNFVDILGWNEDVKYHILNGRPNFNESNRKNVGRVNTILSIISVPLMVNDFLSNIIENVKFIEKINVRLILSTMQKFSRSRGVCVITNKDILEHLKPYLEN